MQLHQLTHSRGVPFKWFFLTHCSSANREKSVWLGRAEAIPPPCHSQVNKSNTLNNPANCGMPNHPILASAQKVSIAMLSIGAAHHENVPTEELLFCPFPHNHNVYKPSAVDPEWPFPSRNHPAMQKCSQTISHQGTKHQILFPEK